MKTTFVLSLLFALIVGAVGASPVYAATLTVNSLNDVNDGVCNATHCSLREAINAAAATGDTITFSVTGTILLASQISFDNKTLTINGPGAASLAISGNHVTRMFNIFPNGVLYLSDVTLKDGQPATLTGGAINSTGQVTLSNVTVSDNTAVTGGGAISSTGTLTVNHTTFLRNTADTGGAINSGGALTVSSSTFDTNSANGEGGAIYNNSLTAMTIDQSSFTNNQAGKTPAATGGAISVNSSSNVSVTNSTFTGNSVKKTADGSANGNGGAIFIGPSVAATSITGSTFDSNFATLGGAVCTVRSLTVSGLTFTTNQASVNGGGLYVDLTSSPSETAGVTTSTFSANSATSGGGIYSVAGTLTVAGSTFSGNNATNGGGILNGSALTVTKSTFSGNNAIGNGGGIYGIGGTLTVANSTFSDNSATNGGGINDESALTVMNSTFSGNNATSGGGIYRSGSTATLRNTIIANSTSGGNCGGLAVTNGGGNIDDGTTCGWGAAAGSMSNTDPMLGTLTGSPAYFPLNSGSPAIGAGDNAVCAAAPVNNESQNGLTRPQGTYCDIGSYEGTGLDENGSDFLWAKSMDGTSDDQGNSIAVDLSGNIYTTGYFEGTADFDPGAGTANLTSAGGKDIFVSKLDSGGNFVWAKRMGGTSSDAGYGIVLDSSGNVYTTGNFGGAADFDPGAGTVNLTSAGNNDIFVSKLDGNGNFVWAKNMGGVSNDLGNGIAVDSSGNIYTTGYFQGAADFDPGAGTFNLTSAMGDDIFVSKLNSSGNFVWAKRMGGGADDDKGNGITVDSSGNVYTTGYFVGTVDFDPGAGTFNLTSAGGRDIFASKLDSGGNFLWAKSMGGVSNDLGIGIAVDSSGNVYTTGYFQGTADFDPGAGTANLTSAGSYDIFVSKLNSSGNFVWAKNMGGTSDDWGSGIAVDSSGNVYTTGDFFDTVDFDPGAGTFNLISAGSYDIFVSKLDGNGNFVWAKSMGGADYERSNSIALDSSRNACMTGYFSGISDFDPGAGLNNLISAGMADIFVAKLENGAPTVTSSLRADPNPTSAASVRFTVTFSESVTGVDTADFTPTTTGSLAGVSVTGVSGGPTTYTVTISTGTGDGTLRLDVNPSGTGIQDLARNALSGGYASGEVYDIDKTAPTATMTSLASDPTDAAPISVTVQFSEPVTGFSVGDILPGNGTIGNFVAVDGDTYTFDLTPSAQGPVTANIAAGVASDSAGNGNTIAAQFQRTYTSVYNLFLALILR